MNCKICGNIENNKEHIVLERFFYTKEPFTYMECGNCHCLQIVDIPEDMSRHYPSDYYTEQPVVELDFDSYSRRNEKKYIEAILTRTLPRLLPCGLETLNNRILDVGCGNGAKVQWLASMGFKKAVGIDKFLHPQHAYESENCKIYQGDIFDINEQFDVVLFNTSFERMVNHKGILTKVSEILTDTGICFISIPVMGSLWDLYGVNWYQIDAPRHFMIHSPQSIDILLEEYNFEKKHSTTFTGPNHFIVSDLYSKDEFVRFAGKNRNLKELITKHYNNEQLTEFNKLAQDCNQQGTGDNLLLYIKKKMSDSK